MCRPTYRLCILQQCRHSGRHKNRWENCAQLKQLVTTHLSLTIPVPKARTRCDLIERRSHHWLWQVHHVAGPLLSLAQPNFRTRQRHRAAYRQPRRESLRARPARNCHANAVHGILEPSRYSAREAQAQAHPATSAIPPQPLRIEEHRTNSRGSY